jgi:hypothetical protein
MTAVRKGALETSLCGILAKDPVYFTGSNMVKRMYETNFTTCQFQMSVSGPKHPYFGMVGICYRWIATRRLTENDLAYNFARLEGRHIRESIPSVFKSTRQILGGPDQRWRCIFSPRCLCCLDLPSTSDFFLHGNYCLQCAHTRCRSNYLSK